MIIETRRSDRGEYQCVATNSAGQVKTRKVLLSYSGQSGMYLVYKSYVIDIEIKGVV